MAAAIMAMIMMFSSPSFANNPPALEDREKIVTNGDINPYRARYDKSICLYIRLPLDSTRWISNGVACHMVQQKKNRLFRFGNSTFFFPLIFFLERKLTFGSYKMFQTKNYLRR
jgi:hypothetical protein